MREVVIRTGSRLHFGLFALDPERQFGGIGMMIDAPGVALKVEEATSLQVIAPEAVSDRVHTFVARFCETHPETPPVRIEISEFIPSHHGLGSGTQLALAVGTALATLADIECSAADIAKATGRGQRSAIGIHGFENGGFLLDAGHSANEPVGKIARRLELPNQWRAVLVTPTDSEGLSGKSELDAFAKLPPMPSTLTTQLRRQVLETLVPAIEEVDFDGFSESLNAFGQQVGEYFSPVQGGVFRSSQAADVATSLRRDGCQAVVQSSWGPTICAFARNPAEASTIASGIHLPTRIVAPMNTGRNHSSS